MVLALTASDCHGHHSNREDDDEGCITLQISDKTKISLCARILYSRLETVLRSVLVADLFLR